MRDVSATVDNRAGGVGNLVEVRDRAEPEVFVFVSELLEDLEQEGERGFEGLPAGGGGDGGGVEGVGGCGLEEGAAGGADVVEIVRGSIG